ncbi:DUF6916 family protein [Aliidongia dinghuensis]|nr:hypothetical protein [Aliidongia dinghuensis]
MDQQITADDFSPLVGRAFAPVGREERLTLVSVERGRVPPRATLRQPFVLFFQGSQDRLLPEGIYRFEVDGGRSFEFHVMPILTPPGAPQDYQAVFN